MFSIGYELHLIGALPESPPAEGGVLVKEARGAVGFGRGNIDRWSYTAASNGRIRFHLKNLLAEGTAGSTIAAWRIDGQDHGDAPAGWTRETPFGAVKQGQVIRIEVHVAEGESAIYSIEADFETQ